MPDLEKLSNIVQIVYKLGRDAENAENRHLKTAKEFFDYGDTLMAMHEALGQKFDPEANSRTSSARLIEALKKLKDASATTAAAYLTMAQSLETCITMAEESAGRRMETKTN